ncbi:MAG: hypothetical protein ACTSWF_05440 [Candidatus Freyarchaeota archaeon]
MRTKNRLRVTMEAEGGSNPWRLRALQTVSFTSPSSGRSRPSSFSSKHYPTLIP